MASSKMSLGRKLMLSSVTLTAVGGTGGYMLYRKRLAENKVVTAADFNAAQDQEKLNASLAWVKTFAQNPATASSGPGLEMFRYTTCPFCGKVKAFLDYHRIPHDTIEVDPMFKKQITSNGYKKVPQLRFGGETGVWFVDSDIIVDTLAERVGAGAQLHDSDVQRWRGWARDSLVRHVTLNINKTLIGAWQGYAYIDAFETIPAASKIFLKVVGAPVMYMVAQYVTKPKLVKAGELKEGDDCRQVLHQQAEYYVKEAHLGDKKPFHGGSEPDLADLDVYGVLQSVRGHAIYEDLLQSTSIRSWIERMDKATGKVNMIGIEVKGA